MKVVLNDFIGVRGRSGSSRGATLVAAAVAESGALVSILQPSKEPKTRAMRLLNMLCWDFFSVPRKSQSVGADVVIHATNTGMTIGRTKSVVVLHDTMVLDHPHLFSKYFVMYAKLCMSISVRRSWRIVTPSEHSRKRILLRWPKATVRVIPWPSYVEGEQSLPKEAGALNRKPETLTVLVVSSIDKHKRLPMAVRAVRAAREASGNDFRLVLVTRPGNDSVAFEAAIASADPQRLWTKTVSGIDDESLSELYKKAFCVLVSSVDEGFCLPALEASANGVPVVHANRGALPEVIPRSFSRLPDLEDDSALLTAQILELLDDGTWRQRRDSDVAHSARFSKRAFRDSWASLLNEAEGT